MTETLSSQISARSFCNVAAEHPDKVARLQQRIEELAKASAKPLFLVEQFKAMQKGLQGELALPNEDAYYEVEEP